MSFPSRIVSVCLCAFAMAACATPVTRFPEISRADIAAGTVDVQRDVIEAHLDRIERTDSIAWPLLVKNADLCWERRTTSFGLSFGNDETIRKIVDGLNKNQVRAVGYSPDPVVLSVASGSPADLAGIKRGARPVRIGGDVLNGDFEKLQEMVNQYRGNQLKARETDRGLRPIERPLEIVFEQDGQMLETALRPETICDIPVGVNESGVINAYATDKSVQIYRGLLLYFPDDEDVAVIIAHEIGHVIGSHVPKQRRNSLVSGYAVWGVPVAGVASIFDLMFAKPLEAVGGVETPLGRSGVTQLNNSILGVRDFEKEADYIGLYIAARAGVDISSAERVFEGFSKVSPASTYGSRSHPVTTERILSVGATRTEIEAKLAGQEDLVPNNWPFPVRESEAPLDPVVAAESSEDPEVEAPQERVILRGNIGEEDAG